MNRILPNRISFYFSLLLLLTSCSTLKKAAKSIQKPKLSVEDVRVTSFNFNELELTYDIKIDNPNPLSLQMLAYDYNLKINDNSFIKGNQPQKMTIASGGESTFEVPMRINFSDLYSTITSLKGADQASYNFLSNLTFNLPVLGKTEVPVSKEGDFPLLKLPKVSLKNIEMKDISLSKADVNVQLAFDNPNGFGMNINNLDYDLMINGKQWAQGAALENTNVRKNGETILNVPLSLNISQIGMSAYKVLIGSEDVHYNLNGSLSLNIAQKLLGHTDFDFQQSGVVPLSP